MRRTILGFILGIIAVLSFKYCNTKREDQQNVVKNTQLIQQQLKNVSKLVVTEGHFAEVYTYKDQKEYFGDYLSFEKKALVVVNAMVSISYDLQQMTYEIDEKRKILHIMSVPEAEIQINPTLHFYDVDDSYFNPFTGDDYNKIQEKVRVQMQDKVVASTLKTNARNRLISELSNVYMLSRSLGWTITVDAPELPEMDLLKTKDSLSIFKD